jgi:hypothetical protein
MDEIKLNDGDGLEILSETKEFLFGCCDCGLVHNITVEHKKESIILRFFRVNKKMAHEKNIKKILELKERLNFEVLSISEEKEIKTEIKNLRSQKNKLRNGRNNRKIN